MRPTSPTVTRTASCTPRSSSAPLVGDALLEAFQLHEHGGHRLPDLVVQFGGDPPAFGLLRGHSPASAVAAFGLQPGQHVVERLNQRGDLPAPWGLQPVRLVEKIHLRHPRRPRR